MVVVTGSAQRLGRQIALALANEGARVVIHYNQNREAALESVGLIENAIAVQSDLTTEQGIEKLVEETLAHFKRWDALVNNASAFSSVSIENLDYAQYEKDQTLHVRAPFFLSKALYDYRREKDSFTPASVVNISDTGVNTPVATRPSYYLAKSSLEIQTKILAKTLAPYVRVNGVAPGAIIPFSATDEHYFEKLSQKVPLKKLATVEDVVAAVLFLMHNKSITGETIVVDAGEHLL